MCNQKPHKHVHKDLYDRKIELKVNEFVTKTMELVDELIDQCCVNINGKLEAKLIKLDDKLAQMKVVIKNDIQEEEE